MKKEEMGRTIDRKKELLPKEVVILSPDQGIAPETAANWLVSLLCQMYFRHGITQNIDRLTDDITTGSCRPWFALREGRPIAAAALIKQTDGSVEIGRAVSLEKGVGGLLMLMAAQDHWEKCGHGLVAEVRLSDSFMGVPSGEATQIICFRHLGLSPQALVPAFNHGNPNRQEMFLFSGADKINHDSPLILPDDKNSIELITETALALAVGSFEIKVEIETVSGKPINSGWEIVFQDPFSLVVPNKKGSDLNMITKESDLRSPFTLIPLSTVAENAGVLIELLNAGFIPCGFDRRPSTNGNPIILFGRLRAGVLVAPIRIVDGLIDPSVIEAINNINQKFR